VAILRRRFLRGGTQSTSEEDDEPVSDVELVKLVAAGSQKAEAMLYSRFQKSLLIMLEQRTKDVARAEDLTQDTLLTVIRRLKEGGIDYPERLTSFVHQTAKYTFIGWVRKLSNQTELRESVDDVSEDRPTIDESLVVEQRRACVRKIIAEMKVPRDREILYRVYVWEQSKPLVCEALELSPQHYDRVVSRARNRFKELYVGSGHDV
jgi:RNA polymerase sigma-70 factor (ECF subfamily)